jgi:hypothetical protein
MKRRAAKNITPVIVGLLIVIVGSMMWNMQESFANRKIREGAIGGKNCTTNKDCNEGKTCVSGACK